MNIYNCDLCGSKNINAEEEIGSSSGAKIKSIEEIKVPIQEWLNEFI